MSYIIRIEWLGGQLELPDESGIAGLYVKSYDPNGYEGRGFIVATEKPEEAQHFSTAELAYEFYYQISHTHHYRPDGKPNRPLTAYTVSLEEHT